MGKERDKNGRFLKGHKHRFTEENQPETNGRKKKLVSYTIDLLKSEGFEQVSEEQIRQIYTLLISLPQERLIALASDNDVPMLYRIVTKEVLGKKGFEMIEKMLDRAHGKATVITKVEHSGKVENGLSNMTIEELFKLRESLKK